MRRLRFASLLLLTGCLLSVEAAAEETAPAALGEESAPESPDFKRDLVYERNVVPFLRQHCYKCHDARESQAGFRIDGLGTDFLAGRNSNMWREVIDRINLGDMPPEAEPRPDPKAAFAVVEWVGMKLKEAEKLARMSGGRILMRRLNRQEYANTVGDLFRLDSHFIEKLKRELPADGKAEGFDRLSSALFFDQTQMASYLEWTAEIAREAVRDAPPTSVKYTWEANKHLSGEPVRQKVNENLDHMIETGPPTYFKTDKGMIIRSVNMYGHRNWEFIDVPAGVRPSLTSLVKEDGYYRIRFKGGSDPGDRGEPIRVRLIYGGGTPLEQTFEFKPNGTLDKPEVTEMTVFLRAGEPDMTRTLSIYWNGIWDARINNPAWDALNLRIMMGGAKIEQAVAKKDDDGLKQARADLDNALAEAKAFTGTRWIHNEKYDIDTLPKLLLDTIEVEGPVSKEWPPASHDVLGIDNGLPKSEADVRDLFAQLLPRAYRRPVDPSEIESIAGVVSTARREHGLSMIDALRMGIQAMLCSPGFVFLQEPRSKADGDEPRRLNDYELASRLSYFLWGSLPDEKLFSLAHQGRLRDPAILGQQVSRMLADPRSKRFVEGFAGQWLDVDQFGTVMPANEYRDYDEQLEAASREEPLAFFQHVLHQNLPITNFLDSDFLVINERLAKHYGIDGVTGPEFRLVPIEPEHHRGGIVGMAGLLTLLSDGTRTLPVRRAAWVLENLLNDPPAPPPPNAGEIQPNTAGKNLSVRERLVLHRNEPTCASCHAKLDGYGLALENYDAIGAWRIRQNGEGFQGPNAPEIDASGVLKSGREFQNLQGFKTALLEERDKFIRAFSEKMLTYALGRPVGYVDSATVEELTVALSQNEDRIETLIQAIVASEPFQTK